MPSRLIESRSRTEARQNFPPDIRMALAEEDLDTFDGAVDKIDGKLSRIQWFALGSFISFTTSAILLLVNILGR